MRQLLVSTSFICTSVLALLFIGAIHYDLPEAGACLIGFALFTINIK